MLVALGEKNVKTVEDLADYATDDLLGWNERKDKETSTMKAFSTASPSASRRSRI